METQQNVHSHCRRCPSQTLVRLTKTRRLDNEVYRCARCGFIFSPSLPLAAEDHAPGQPHNPAVVK